MTVMAISTARNNAELIEQCAALGYLPDDMVTLDPTYGLGRFWTRWRPAALDTPADQDHGIRGGLTRNQRNKLRGQR